MPAVLLGIFFAAACQSTMSGEETTGQDLRPQHVRIVLQVDAPDDPCSVKSAFTASDQTVADCNLLFFDGGMLAAKYYRKADADLLFEVVAGRTYDCYCIANAGDVTDAFELGRTTVSDMESWRLEAALPEAAGLPMAGKCSDLSYSKAQLQNGVLLNIGLSRLVAQYDVVIDKSALSRYSFTATALSVCGASSVAPFAESSKGTAQAVRTDYALEADLEALNGGRKSTYYPLENCNGSRPAVEDAWQKIPDSLADGAVPTYVEISGQAVLEDGSGLSFPLTYRFCLGRNATDDFDVRRNEVHTVTLVLTDEAVEREEPSWKIEKGSYTDTRDLSFAAKTLSVVPGSKASVAVVRTPEQLKYILRLDASLTKAGVSVSGVVPGDPADKSSLTFSAPSGASKTEGKVTILTLDGKKSADLALQIEPRLNRISIVPDEEVDLVTGGETCSFTAQASYMDGSVRDVTELAEWSVGDPEILQNDGAGRISSKMTDGSTYVKVSYTEGSVTRTASVTVNVGKVLVDLKAYPSVVYLPDTGNEWAGSGENYFNEARANDFYLKLIATYHDGSTADVTYDLWKTEWKVNLPLRYLEEPDVWHILNVRRYHNYMDPNHFLIYRGYSRYLSNMFLMGESGNAAYQHRVWDAAIVEKGSPKLFMRATHTHGDVSMTVDILGSIDEEDRVSAQ